MKRHCKVETYADAAGEWRWRLVAGNGEVLADSGEGYASRGNLRRALRRMTSLDVAGSFIEAYKATPTDE